MRAGRGAYREAKEVMPFGHVSPAGQLAHRRLTPQSPTGIGSNRVGGYLRAAKKAKKAEWSKMKSGG
jgi:hypothetical protein